jgi:hypothetical protein
MSSNPSEGTRTPLEDLIERRGRPGVSTVPTAFLELFELKDVLPEIPTNAPISHS